VYAQSFFTDNIRKIAGENNLQFIIATHSPTIIGDHGDLTYDLLTGEFDD
jgi:predicted ATPase